MTRARLRTHDDPHGVRARTDRCFGKCDWNSPYDPPREHRSWMDEARFLPVPIRSSAAPASLFGSSLERTVL